MIFIAHRGNLTGPNQQLENSPAYIDAARIAGFHVEIDVWQRDEKFYLGHDQPDHAGDCLCAVKRHRWQQRSAERHCRDSGDQRQRGD